MDAFLHERIGFTRIYPLITEALEAMPMVTNPTLGDYVEVNAATRRFVQSLIEK